jgi:hypothetical protein
MDFEAVKKVLAALEREDVLYVVFGAGRYQFPLE